MGPSRPFQSLKAGPFRARNTHSSSVLQTTASNDGRSGCPADLLKSGKNLHPANGRFRRTCQANADAPPHGRFEPETVFAVYWVIGHHRLAAATGCAGNRNALASRVRKGGFRVTRANGLNARCIRRNAGQRAETACNSRQNRSPKTTIASGTGETASAMVATVASGEKIPLSPAMSMMPPPPPITELPGVFTASPSPI